MEEEDLEYPESEISISMDDSSNDNDEDANEDSDNDQNGWSDDNIIKKRKRKSTNQIKMLKQELDGEMNWSKDKIVKMADLTGLSQSQVYKWCWDQKKKQGKNKDDFAKNVFQRRKLIRKDLSYRAHCNSSALQEVSYLQNQKMCEFDVNEHPDI